MSLPLLDVAELEDDAVLKEALAFLDALETTSSPLPLDDWDESASGGHASANALPAQPKRRRRREREAEADVARRRRKKDERLALSREVLALEQRLAVLRRNTKRKRESIPRANAVGSDAAGEWERRALAEAHESAVATDLNRNLRDAIQRQHAMLTNLRDALARAQPRHLLNVQPPSVYRLEAEGRPDRDARLMLALKSSTLQQFDELDSVITPSTSSKDMVASTFAVKMDPVRGPYSEHTTMTVVPKELGVVAALVEDSLLQLSPPCADLEFFVQTCPSEECLGFEKQYTIALRSPGGTVPMSGAGFIRIYREPRRVVVLWSKELRHSAGLRFLERSWFVATRSPVHPSTQCVVRSCYRLDVEKPRGRPVSEQEEDVSSFIQSKLIARMRGKLETIQFRLLERSKGEDLSPCFCPHCVTCARL